MRLASISISHEARELACNGLELKSPLKRRREEDDDDEEAEDSRRQQMENTEDAFTHQRRLKIDNMKETSGRIAANPTLIVPAALRATCRDRQYDDINDVWGSPEELKSKQEADAFVDSFCHQFVESIAVSSKGYWLYVTQAEAYMRDAKTIDDCANTTVAVGHPARPAFVLEQKREFQNQWHEAKLYFKNFELLVTGCLCGTYEDGNSGSSSNSSSKIYAFLGASLGKHAGADDYWRVYVPLVPTQVVSECRLLRSSTKAASGLQWLLKSRRFHANGYSTACALNLHELDGIDSTVAIGSLLLRWKALGQQNKQQLRSMLSQVNEMRGLDVDATIESVTRVRELEIAKGKKMALEMPLLTLSDEGIKDSDYVEMFKAMISSRLITLNKQAIRQKKYLL
ncbi:hypothetical protein MBANPS3_008035 [Mucor bainieri]